jgi:hypothetical protein
LEKIISIFILGIIILSGIGANAFEPEDKTIILIEKLEISRPNVVEKTDYFTIELNEANSNYLKEGKPFLPAISKVFTFEFGTTINNVDVTFSDISIQRISKPIEPSPTIQIRNGLQLSQNSREKNDFEYSGLGTYPKERFSWNTAAGIKNKDQVIYCIVSINPIQYNFDDNTITYCQNVNIKIEYKPPDNPIIFADEYDLLIITPAEFKSTLQRLVDHKESRNIRTKLVTLDEIPSQGVDTQESIKYFIRDARETLGVDHLILVGSGVEGKEKFPVRKAWISDMPHEENFASDLYYADFYNSTGGFPDWDYDGDGEHAEYPRDKPNMDIVPDIHLGKIPCNTNDELDIYIDRIIYYDEHNKMTKKIVQIGGDTAPGDTDKINEGEYTNSVVLSKLPGYTTTKLWDSLGTITKRNIANGFKKIIADFVDFSGHGSPKSFATHPHENEDKWIPAPTLLQLYDGWDVLSFDIYSVKNPTKFPIVFYNTCSNNKYTKTEECLSWKTLIHQDGGGIISFGASGIAYGGDGTADAERAFGWMEVHAHEEIFKNKNLGIAWSNCVSGYYNTFQSSLDREDYKTMLEFSMFGDPTLNAVDGDDPRIRSYQPEDFGFFSRFMYLFPKILEIFKTGFETFI